MGATHVFNATQVVMVDDQYTGWCGKDTYDIVCKGPERVPATWRAANRWS
ncbi:uncharacterized protein HELO_2009 [Halomonas elongata DSM 2581]|uniref:Uncharacterized protein n=1 Tax=Halomonas elongata (strain ATCC 33173 / DSM 2581 / NBRC 15536 / NCIMB 2198 / 1H9) TaxID=768066 RepID=E1V9Q9_HALED|nr:uncharacterized protein HELO_2009 [Halomonas elongata DSM 2581]